MSNEKLLINDIKSNNSEFKSNNEEKQIEKMANIINEMDEPNAHYYDEILQMHEAFADSFTIAKALYNAGYRKQEWISVEDRLPEVGTRVVGYDYESNVRCYFITEGRWWIDDGWNTAKGWGITHWMPLPEAPKMKGDSDAR